jgi:hypothetical protein
MSYGEKGRKGMLGMQGGIWGQKYVPHGFEDIKKKT